MSLSQITKPDQTNTMASGSSQTVIIAALLGNGAIACTKFAASVYTGSSAMLSEAIHSLASISDRARWTLLNPDPGACGMGPRRYRDTWRCSIMSAADSGEVRNRG